MDAREEDAEDRTEQLLNFQSITGLDDLERCRQLMAKADWDLSRAVMEHFGDFPPRSPSGHADPAPWAADEPLRRQHPVDSLPVIPPAGTDRPPRLTIKPSSHVVYTGNSAPVTQLSTFDWIKATISLPFRFIFTSIFDIFKFVWSFLYGPVFAPSSPTEDVQNFIQEFEAKFGSNHPIFYRGGYKEAYSDAKRELRFLLLYLHQQDQVDSDRFCSDTLVNQEVVALINSRTLFWGCSTKYAEGHKVAQALQSTRYPTLGLVAFKAGQMTLVGRLQGYHSPQELVVRLQQLFDSNDRHLTAARHERQQLDLNQSLRKEQDEAYQKSLKADQDKERKKREELARKVSEELKLKENQERILREQKQKEQDLARRKKEAEENLPTEPIEDTADVCRTSIKLPNNRRLSRRFLRSNNTQDLYNFVLSQPDSPKAFEIYTSYPRKALDCKPQVEMTLASLGFGKTETFLVEELEESEDELELDTTVPAAL